MQAIHQTAEFALKRILFVASLHHPEQLQQEIAAAPHDPPLIPSSMSLHFYEKALKARGVTLDIFWRNLPGFGPRDVSRLRTQRHSARLTPGKIVGALLRRIPPALHPDIQRRNALLLQQARRFQPDLLWLIGDNTIILPQTLSAIREATGCRILYASGTSPIVFSHSIEREAARLYDLALVNDLYHGMQWLELGAKRMACLPYVAIDPDFHQPPTLSDEEKARYACDVTFVGTLMPQQLYSERVAALEALRDFDLGIWSVHDVPPRLRPHLRGAALGAQMMRVLAGSTISLNPHGDFMRYGGNMRLFEAAALGAFQLCDDRPGIREWFRPDEHLVIYHSLDDLRAKVVYYLAHPEERAALATAAREHVLKHHTYAQRLDQIEAMLAENA